MVLFNNVIIAGAGIGGLSAAAAISPYCKRVTLIEKDPMPAGIEVRKAIPQGAHIHILLRSGLNLLEALLPNIGRELEQAGSVRIVTGKGQQIHEFGHWQPSRELDLYFLSQSRPFLEHHLRRRTLLLDNINLIQSTIVDVDISTEAANIRLKDGTTVSGDLLIDASGAGRPLVKYLREKQLLKVDMTHNNIDIFYSTVHFQKPQQWHNIQENILVIPDPSESKLGGSLLSIQDETWCVSLHGRAGVKPPNDYDEWCSMARTLPAQRIWERIADAPPITDLQNFRKPHASWMRFDQAENIPDRYIPLGDTITSVNPIYGQGMSVAIGHANALATILANTTTNDVKQLQNSYIDQATNWSRTAWKKAENFDRHYLDDTDKQSASSLDIVRRLTLAQHDKAAMDETFHLKMAKQAQMLSEPLLGT